MTALTAAGPLRRPGRPCAVQLRDALKVYLWQHMSSCGPATWLSSYELCRIVAQRYTHDAPSGHWQGRQVVLVQCLAELEAAGEVETREFRRDASRTVRRYRWRPAEGTA